MLVLNRKRFESLVIADNIVVTIVRIAGNTVRVGVEAPPEIRIRRKEIPSYGDRPTKSKQDS